MINTLDDGFRIPHLVLFVFLIVACFVALSVGESGAGPAGEQGMKNRALKDFLETYYYLNTGFERIREIGPAWRFVEKRDHVTMRFYRFKEHPVPGSAPVTKESVSLVFPQMPKVGKVDLGTGKGRIAFWARYGGRSIWGLENKGVKGYLDIVAVNEKKIVAKYDITLDAVEVITDQVEPRRRETRFEGQSTFEEQHRTTPNDIAADVDSGIVPGEK